MEMEITSPMKMTTPTAPAFKNNPTASTIDLFNDLWIQVAQVAAPNPNTTPLSAGAVR
jgi:hypothetical protein